jgi:hypothetical protein
MMIIVWAVNDHILKALYGNWWTGKLSDLSGLVVFPVALYSAYEIYWAVRKQAPKHLKLTLKVSVLITGGLLFSINTVSSVEHFSSFAIAYIQWPFRALMSLFKEGPLPTLNVLKTTMDATDLLTLPTLIIPYILINSTLSESTSSD